MSREHNKKKWKNWTLKINLEYIGTLLGYESTFLNFFLCRRCLKNTFIYLKNGTVTLTDINKHPSKIHLWYHKPELLVFIYTPVTLNDHLNSR